MKPIGLRVVLILCLAVLAGCNSSRESDAAASAGKGGAEKTTNRPEQEKSQPVIRLETSMGAITIALDSARAPVTVANFLDYIDRGYYTGLIFHRVIPGFMIQGGGLQDDMTAATPSAPISNESSNGLANLRGTIAMARTSDPDSATSQFFINLVDNASLDYQPGKPGYAVFGRVSAGMDVVDRIAGVETVRKSGHSNVPREAVVITRALRVTADEPIAPPSDS